MSDFLVCIVNKGYGEKISAFLSERNEKNNLLSLAKGTAPTKLLSLFGLGEHEKEIVWCNTKASSADALLRGLESNVLKNKGIAFTVPSDTTFKNNMKEDFIMSDYCLIIAITDKGYTEEVMDAARSAGATGGTALNARGVGLPNAEKFFGVTLQAEKEMVLIMSSNKTAQAIASAVAEVRGSYPESRTVVFRLPVSDIAGFTL